MVTGGCNTPPDGANVAGRPKYTTNSARNCKSVSLPFVPCNPYQDPAPFQRLDRYCYGLAGVTGSAVGRVHNRPDRLYRYGLAPADGFKYLHLNYAEAFHFFTLPSPRQTVHILSALVLASILVPRPEQTGQGIVSSFGLRNLGFSTFFLLNREAS